MGLTVGGAHGYRGIALQATYWQKIGLQAIRALSAVWWLSCAVLSGLDTTAGLARSVFQTHLARAGSRARWNGEGHSNIPGYGDTVFQTDGNETTRDSYPTYMNAIWVWRQSCAVLSGLHTTAGLARSVFQTHLARAGSRARWNGWGHSNIPGYRDTVFQTDDKATRDRFTGYMSVNCCVVAELRSSFQGAALLQGWLVAFSKRT
ncbi:MAG: hypothetical protein IKP81_00415 [Paludibacteraceae bacterium]|nr:hypothetical protein [Paludibacteraceae bacterium]